MIWPALTPEVLRKALTSATAGATGSPIGCVPGAGCDVGAVDGQHDLELCEVDRSPVRARRAADDAALDDAIGELFQRRARAWLRVARVQELDRGEALPSRPRPRCANSRCRGQADPSVKRNAISASMPRRLRLARFDATGVCLNVILEDRRARHDAGLVEADLPAADRLVQQRNGRVLDRMAFVDASSAAARPAAARASRRYVWRRREALPRH